MSSFEQLPQIEFPIDVQNIFTARVFCLCEMYLSGYFLLSLCFNFFPIFFIINPYLTASGVCISLGIMYFYPTKCSCIFWVYVFCKIYTTVYIVPSLQLEISILTTLIPFIIYQLYVTCFKKHTLSIWLITLCFILSSCGANICLNVYVFNSYNVVTLMLNIGNILYISNVLFFTKQAICLYTPTQYINASKYVLTGPIHLLKSVI